MQIRKGNIGKRPDYPSDRISGRQISEKDRLIRPKIHVTRIGGKCENPCECENTSGINQRKTGQEGVQAKAGKENSVFLERMTEGMHQKLILPDILLIRKPDTEYQVWADTDIWLFYNLYSLETKYCW